MKDKTCKYIVRLHLTDRGGFQDDVCTGMADDRYPTAFLGGQRL